MRVQFRDGPKEIAEYQAAMLSAIKTETMTYEEAMAEANRKAERDYINKQAETVISSHLRGLRGR